MTEKLERILKFVLDRKKPVTAKLVGQQFCIAQATAATHLRHLHEAGHITRQQVKGKVFWGKQGDEPFVPVAVPDKRVEPVRPTIRIDEPEVVIRQSEQIKSVWPTNPYKTSYPHIRGYDD